MGLPLATDALARLETATRTLLSPLAFGDADDWRAEAMRTVGDVVGAESATFYLPGQDRLIAYAGIDAHYGEQIAAFTEAVWLGGDESPDPILPVFHRGLLARGLDVWNMHTADHLLGGGGAAWGSLFYHEVLRHIHCGDTHALFVGRPEGSYMLSVHTLRQAPGPTEYLPALRVLLPAFKAGLDAHTRLRASRSALDAVGAPLAAFSADGAPLHRSAALEALLGADPEGPRVEVALAALAARVRPLAFGRRADGPAVAPPVAEVHTARAAYALRAALLPAGAFGPGEAFLVTVRATGAAPAFPTADAVRQRFGLTRREAEVALLVAEGHANDAIAERLFVSPHTVRHHVEAAMAKLELTGRGREAVAAALLGAGVA